MHLSYTAYENHPPCRELSKKSVQIGVFGAEHCVGGSSESLKKKAARVGAVSGLGDEKANIPGFSYASGRRIFR